MDGEARMKQTFYSLPEADCERLNRTEMQAIRWSLAAINSVAYAQDDLKDRLDCIPHGRVRWRLMLGQLRALCYDLIGTVPKKQCKQIRNTMDDMELRMVPKLTPMSHRVNMDLDDLSYLVSHAKKDICTACILNGDECRKCELYQILEAVAPLQDYGKGTICPYMKEDWLER
jgi:hypothetical protein